MVTLLVKAFYEEMATSPPPTGEEMAKVAADNWQLVAEAAGIVEFRPGGDPMSPGDIYLTPLGLRWLGLTKLDTQ